MKRFLSLLTIIILVASVGLLTGCGPEIVGTKLSESQDMSGTVAGKLTLNGSTSMTRVCQALGEAFSEKYPGVSVEKSGTGSGDAPNSVRSGIALIGDMSRDLKESENPDEFEIKQIAIDGIAIAVHKDNPVQDLTTEQIQKIFTGEITNWSELGGQDKAITTLGREAASGYMCLRGVRGGWHMAVRKYPGGAAKRSVEAGRYTGDDQSVCKFLAEN